MLSETLSSLCSFVYLFIRIVIRWQLDSDTPLHTQSGVHKDRVSSLRYLNKVEPCLLVSSGFDGYIHLLESQSLIRLASFCLGESITSIDTNLIGSLVVYGTVSGVVGIIGVSSDSDVSAGLFERGPYLFKQDNKMELLGELVPIIMAQLYWNYAFILVPI